MLTDTLTKRDMWVRPKYIERFDLDGIGSRVYLYMLAQNSPLSSVLDWQFHCSMTMAGEHTFHNMPASANIWLETFPLAGI